MAKANELKEDEYYLPPGDFFNQVIESLMESDEPTPRLVNMFMLLSQRIPNHRYFIGYPHLRDDIVSTGYLACIKAYKGFRPYKSKEDSLRWLADPRPIDYDYEVCNSPFAFFTTCIMNDVFRLMKAEYNHHNAVNAMRVRYGLDADYGYTEMLKDQESQTKEEKGDDEQKNERADPDDRGPSFW